MITKYTLEITVFTCGALVMIFELAGSRVLGPYLGTSIFVWTSLIGIILGSLSLGYWLGGKVADKKPDINALSFFVFLAAVAVGFTIIIKDTLLVLLIGEFSSIKVNSFAASLILFSPASVLLGMISPYAVKLKLSNLNTSGSTVGNLYALSTAGSIAGTFLSGFYLIPWFGTNKILIMIVLALILVSIILSVKNFLRIKLTAFALLLISLVVISKYDHFFKKTDFIDIDTQYNRVWIYDYFDEKKDKKIRFFSINNESSSAMFLDDDELVFDYTKYYHLARHFNPDFKKTLMIGGAGYSFPKDFLKKYPQSTIDVVEIDPKLTQLARQYFRLKDSPRLKIYHEDGRVFLNRTREKYDIIFGDAFSSQHSLPYQLTTKEAVKRKYDILNENGVVILNIISALEGKKSIFLKAEYATYKSVFGQVYLFPVKDSHNSKMVQNIILVALKENKDADFESADPELKNYLGQLWKKEIILDTPILTDDHAPVDYYIGKAI